MAKRKSALSNPLSSILSQALTSQVKVPESFMLAGTSWVVQDIDHLQDLGECDRDTATIKIRAGLSPQIRAQTFYHELMHAILFTTGLQDHSEKEVDLIGSLLHQYELTRKDPCES